MSIYGGAVTGSTRGFLPGSEEVQSSDGLVLCFSHRFRLFWIEARHVHCCTLSVSPQLFIDGWSFVPGSGESAHHLWRHRRLCRH